MNPSEIAALVRVARPAAPYGVRCLARVHSIDGLARVARRRLPAGALAYLDGGGEDEYTLRRNRSAFDDIELLPRIMHEVAERDTSVTVLGAHTRLPLVLAPVGAPRLFHHDGELAVARAAGLAAVPYSVSTLATVSLERIADEAAGPLWFQLYMWGDRSVAKGLIDRAKASDYSVLIVTVDVAARSKRERELRAGVALPSPRLTVGTALEGALHPSWWWHFLTTDAPTFPNVPPDQSDGTKNLDVSGLFDGSASWEDLAWIRDAWPGPIVVKGILAPEDASRAADLGVDGIVVSNHGGRQLDHVPATIDVLPRIVDEVGDRLEVLLDSGVRRGTDVVAALALGARAVLVGRAYLYGLAAAGQPGVSHAVDILAEELRIAMALIGVRKLDELDRSFVRPRTSGPATDPRSGSARTPPAALTGTVQS